MTSLQRRSGGRQSCCDGYVAGGSTTINNSSCRERLDPDEAPIPVVNEAISVTPKMNAGFMTPCSPNGL
jgi:hypothetical protein